MSSHRGYGYLTLGDHPLVTRAPAVTQNPTKLPLPGARPGTLHSASFASPEFSQLPEFTQFSSNLVTEPLAPCYKGSHAATLSVGRPVYYKAGFHLNPYRRHTRPVTSL